MALQERVLAALKAERERQGLTQLDVSMRMGISLSVFNKIERSAKGNVKLETLLRYANALGKHIELEIEDGPVV